MQSKLVAQIGVVLLTKDCVYVWDTQKDCCAIESEWKKQKQNTCICTQFTIKGLQTTLNGPCDGA